MNIKVDPSGSCTGCPFFEDEAWKCRATGLEFFKTGGYNGRPEWCPLDEGSVLVELRKPTTTEES